MSGFHNDQNLPSTSVSSREYCETIHIQTVKKTSNDYEIHSISYEKQLIK